MSMETGHYAELGFTLSHDAQGAGHATRAVAAAATLLFHISAVATISVTDAPKRALDCRSSARRHRISKSGVLQRRGVPGNPAFARAGKS